MIELITKIADMIKEIALMTTAIIVLIKSAKNKGDE